MRERVQVIQKILSVACLMELSSNGQTDLAERLPKVVSKS